MGTFPSGAGDAGANTRRRYPVPLVLRNGRNPWAESGRSILRCPDFAQIQNAGILSSIAAHQNIHSFHEVKGRRQLRKKLARKSLRIGQG